MDEQGRIEVQLHEREVRDIQVGLELTHIGEDEQMSVDNAAPAQPRPIEAKLRALEKFVRVTFNQVAPPSHHHHHPLFFIMISLTLTACPRISPFVISFIHILMTILYFFREAVSVSNMVTRCRDYQLKKP